MRLRAREAAPAIARLLSNKHQMVRGNAVWALGGLGSKEHVPQILALLDDPASYVRANAITALGYMGAKDHRQTNSS